MFEYVDQKKCGYLKFNHLENNFFKIIFSTRKGGVSTSPFDSLNLGLHVNDKKENVIKNRDIFSKNVCIDSKSVIIAEQIHNNKIAVVDKNSCGRGYFSHSDSLNGFDGMITKEKNIPLFALFADCVPIFLFDYKNKVAGIAHAGWKGTLSKISVELVKKAVKEFSSKLDDIRIIIGPSISAKNYEVGKELSDLFIKKFNTKNDFLIKSGNKYYLDLKKANKNILLDYGISSSSIFIEDSYCTFRDEELFFSYRRDGTPTGRMAGIIEII